VKKPQDKTVAQAPAPAPRKRHPPPVPRAAMRRVVDNDSPSPRKPTRMMTKKEVAELCAVSPVTLWKWVRAGTFPRGFNLGGKTVWRADDIAKWQAELPTAQVKPTEWG
jgi:prophage regulatory protein